MNDYEFWNELGKIFNAVVAYQEKAVEFNNRFINPWIRLGNVFDQRDRNQEEMCAFEKALELDPANAQNWYELGNLRFRTKNYDQAVEAYNKSIEFSPEHGWSYNNLALTLVSQGKYSEALPLYQKGVDLIEDDKDKAVVWNRIGNVYRKLNLYDLAVEAFQKADDLDAENAGFRDELDDVPESTAALQSNIVQTQEQDPNQEPTPTQDPSPIQSILSESQPEDTAPIEINSSLDSVVLPEAIAAATEAQPAVEATQSAEPEISESAVAQTDAEDGAEGIEQVVMEQVVNDDATIPAAQAEDLPLPQPDQESASEEQTAPVVVQENSETHTEIPAIATVTTTETTEVVVTADETDDEAIATVTTTETTEVAVTADQTDDEPAAPSEEILNVSTDQTSSVATVELSTLSVEEMGTAASEGLATSATAQPEAKEAADQSAVAEADVEIEDQVTTDDALTADQLAYDAYLKDNDDLILKVDEQPEDSMPEALQEPATMVDPSGELQMEMDTKNAHVWNELGNIYFNTGAFDDATVAYSKAIQLDRWFAWPYSNLALTYVQKGRFTEAILLYQRSIELFTSEKDKAVSWNRLGNVYRRLNNYDGAISAYQRADELDPENTTLSLQSRFSLLGNYSMEQMPSRVSQTEELS